MNKLRGWRGPVLATAVVLSAVAGTALHRGDQSPETRPLQGEVDPTSPTQAGRDRLMATATEVTYDTTDFTALNYETFLPPESITDRHDQWTEVIWAVSERARTSPRATLYTLLTIATNDQQRDHGLVIEKQDNGPSLLIGFATYTEQGHVIDDLQVTNFSTPIEITADRTFSADLAKALGDTTGQRLTTHQELADTLLVK